jgi:hypothetical protein
VRHFFAHVAGESYRNSDGSDRQAIIPCCRVGELLLLEHEPDNPHDINAIRVLRQSGEQVGYLEREFAGEVVSRTAKGWQYYALVAGFGRAGGTGPYGMALLVVVDDGDASAEDVLTYGRRVLARDRDVGVPVAAPQATRRVMSAGDRPGAHGDRIVTLAVSAVIVLAILVALALALR